MKVRRMQRKKFKFDLLDLIMKMFSSKNNLKRFFFKLASSWQSLGAF